MSVLNNSGVVVLAAGSSSRLGEPKQLVQFQDKPLLQKVIDSCSPLEFGSKVIVLGANSGIIQKNVHPGSFRFVVNEDWTEGIASSIRKGVDYTLEQNPETEHLLFLLSDQPFVTTELLQQLWDTHVAGTGEMTASFYNDDIGVPAIFSRSMFPLLKELRGDQGAKKIMKRYQEKVSTVDFNMGYFDIDTPDDYAELRQFES